MARPPKLDDELTETIAAKIREGHDPAVVAQSVGIHRVTFHRWMREGRADQTGETPQYSFATAVARAQAEAEITLADRTLAGDGVGQSFGKGKAALEVLSRRIPSRWAQRVNIKVERELTELLEVVQGICSEEDFERVLEAIAARDSEAEAFGDS